VPHEMRMVDALAGLRGLDDESVDLVVTDPPYDTLEKWREMGTTTRLKQSSMSSNEWFPTVDFDYLRRTFTECHRVMRRGTDCYVMCDEETGDALKPILREIGFELRKSLIWHKVGKREKVSCPNCGAHVCDRHTKGTPGMGYPYRSVYEMVLLARKGKRKLPEDKSVRNFLEVLPVPWIKHGDAYPTEKPVGLCEILIRQSSDEGELVLDPFAGSGSCGEAAFNLRRNFLGFDVEQRAIDYFHERRQGWVYDDPADAPKMTGGILDMFGD
jgi:site-specific DNA-methyltransferase (adenine-specific)